MSNNELPPELAAFGPLIEAGKALFASNDARGPGAESVTRYQVLMWLMHECMDQGITLMRHQSMRIVDAILNAANRVMVFDGHTLTAAHLRDVLARVPENTPVLYQRLEDALFDKQGWKATRLQWGSEFEVPEQTAKEALAQVYPQMRVRQTDDGRWMAHEMCDYVPAFDAYVLTDDEGRKAVCITAHY